MEGAKGGTSADMLLLTLPSLCKEIIAGLLQRRAAVPVRICNDLDASHFSHFEAQEVG